MKFSTSRPGDRDTHDLKGTGKNYRALPLLMVTVLFMTVLTAPGQDGKTAGGRKTFKHDEKIVKEYDRSNDKTSLKLQMNPLTCVKDGCLFFSLETSFPGTEQKAVLDRYVFALYIFTKTLEPFAQPNLLASIDGRRVDLGEMTFAGKESKDGLTGMAYGVMLDDGQMAELAKARKVELRLGSLAFALSEDKLNAIADFYSQAAFRRPQ